MQNIIKKIVFLSFIVLTQKSTLHASQYNKPKRTQQATIIVKGPHRLVIHCKPQQLGSCNVNPKKEKDSDDLQNRLLKRFTAELELPNSNASQDKAYLSQEHSMFPLNSELFVEYNSSFDYPLQDPFYLEWTEK